ncbi:MAG TPA: hypothetical protein PK711_10860 [Bacteroidales bacterium]|nr:hypothetical protein [Bacteroidales bacterium]HRZ20930.1 hypothetical protein [Bacteroidales bacterium]
MEDTLFTGIADIQKYVAVSLTSSEDVIHPYLKQATSKYLVPILGEDTIEAFRQVVHGSSSGEEPELMDAIYLTKGAVARFAYYLALSMLNVHIGDAGIMVASTSNLAPASKHRTDELKADLLVSGWDAVNLLLKHLDRYKEELGDLFTEELTAMYSLFVTNADEYQRFVNIEHSFLRFYNLRQAIERAEILHLMPVLSQELYGEIKAQLSQNNVSEANQQLLLPIKAFVCYKSAQQEIDPKYGSYADHALAYIKRYLDDHLEDYPLYANSSVYDGSKTSYAVFENDDEHGFFVFQ